MPIGDRSAQLDCGTVASFTPGSRHQQRGLLVVAPQHRSGRSRDGGVRLGEQGKEEVEEEVMFDGLVKMSIVSGQELVPVEFAFSRVWHSLVRLRIEPLFPPGEQHYGSFLGGEG